MNEFFAPSLIPWVLTVLGGVGFLFFAFQALQLLKK
jgi:hypothetical protein